ncbi:MAG: helix-turn-helix transcriptional regulator [Candidatus Sulfotelmatobacter sp.]
MTSPYSTGSDSYSPTIYRPAPSAGIVATAAVAFAFLVGTGGTTSPDYFQQRGERGYQFAQIPVVARVNAGARPPIENLKQIRAVFRPSILDLAGLLSVSRQAVYNWMAGERPSPESANRLEDLAKAADLVAAYGLSTPYLLRRKIRDGKNLMDIVRDGGSAHDAARSLVRIAEQEAKQRGLLKNRLAGRQLSRPDDSEFGIPMLDEQIGS